VTALFRHRGAGWRERLVLWLVRRLIPDTPLVINMAIGPDYGALNSHNGRSILVDRVAFDVSEFTRELARHAGAPSTETGAAGSGATYDPRADGLNSYLFGRACERELGIRAGRIAPEPQRPQEMAWAAEGPRPTGDLDTVSDWRPPE